MESIKDVLISLCGCSGSGKDTILKIMMGMGFECIVTDTTREIRKGEKNGVDHYFISDEEYDKKLASGQYIATTVYRGKKYGTDKKFVKGVKVVILDPKGIEGADKYVENHIVVNIVAGEEVRLNRLIKRCDTPESIAVSLFGDKEVFFQVEKRADLTFINNDDDFDELKKNVENFVDNVLSLYLR